MDALRNTLADLPDEVITSILYYVPPLSTVALERTSRHFSHPTNEPLLWRYYCATFWKYWDQDHDLANKLTGPALNVDWKRLFIRRRLTDLETTDLLNSILESQPGRINKFQKIVTLGYDAKDTLLRHYHVGNDADDVLARRYFSEAVLGFLHRTKAIPEWERLRNGEDVPLDRALGVYDMFVLRDREGDFDDIRKGLQAIVKDIRESIPNIQSETPRKKAHLIARYLKNHDLTGITSNDDYHHIRHNFIGLALLDSNHSSLPLISVAIFCCIAVQLGIDARPCGFPFHVYAVIYPPPGQNIDEEPVPPGPENDSPDEVPSASPIYMDPFRSAEEVPASSLESQLTMMGTTTPAARAHFLGDAPISEIVLRCGRNIGNSEQPAAEAFMTIFRVDPVSDHINVSRNHNIIPEPAGAVYASLWSSMLLGDPGTAPEAAAAPEVAEFRRRHLPRIVEHFTTHYPTDVSLIERYILPLFEHLPDYPHLASYMHAVRATDSMPKRVRRRSTDTENVVYKVGQVFRHRRYRYLAVITGWDTKCDAEPGWIQRNGVDRLPGGREQSFYHALVSDRSSRYVAEENIIIETPRTPYELMEMAGKYFKRWDEQSKRFVSNIKDEYPDD